MIEPHSTDELIKWVKESDRRMRAEQRRHMEEYVRYVTETPWEQQLADARAYDRAVLEKGWIVSGDKEK